MGAGFRRWIFARSFRARPGTRNRISTSSTRRAELQEVRPIFAHSARFGVLVAHEPYAFVESDGARENRARPEAHMGHAVGARRGQQRLEQALAHLSSSRLGSDEQLGNPASIVPRFEAAEPYHHAVRIDRDEVHEAAAARADPEHVAVLDLRRGLDSVLAEGAEHELDHSRHVGRQGSAKGERRVRRRRRKRNARGGRSVHGAKPTLTARRTAVDTGASREGDPQAS